MKTCRVCGLVKPLDDFPRKKGPPDGRAGLCKSCQREYCRAHYQQNREYYIRKARARRPIETARHLESMRALLRDLKNVPCADCGGSYSPWVMHFDHVTGHKRFNVGTGLRQSRKSLLEEIAKCEVVCANCHAIRTYNRLHARP